MMTYMNTELLTEMNMLQTLIVVTPSGRLISLPSGLGFSQNGQRYSSDKMTTTIYFNNGAKKP